MKKTLIIALVAILCVSMLAGCGSKEPAASPSASASSSQAAVSGTPFDAGNVTVTAPDGWTAYAVADVFSDKENATDPDQVQIGKGTQSDWDLLTHPYIQIIYYGPDSTMMTPAKDFYDEAKDLEPITAGEYTWNGFTGKSFDYPIAVLWTEDGDHQYQANIWLKMEKGEISVNDADVQAILASVAPSK